VVLNSVEIPHDQVKIFFLKFLTVCLYKAKYLKFRIFAAVIE